MIGLTAHAVARYRDRHARHLTRAQAKSELETLLPRASRLPELSLTGQEQWRVEGSAVILIVKHDPTVGPVAVTVLEGSMVAPTSDELDEFRAAFERDQAARSRFPLVLMPICDAPQVVPVPKKAPKKKKRCVSEETDPISALKEHAEQTKNKAPKYVFFASSKNMKAASFGCSCAYIDFGGYGTGRTKKAAQHDAAERVRSRILAKGSV